MFSKLKQETTGFGPQPRPFAENRGALNKRGSSMTHPDDHHLKGKKRVDLEVFQPQRKRQAFDVYVANFPSNMDDDKLKRSLEGMCNVKCIRLTKKDHYAFFQVEGRKAFEQALSSLKGRKLGGRVLKVQQAKGRSKNQFKKNIAEALYFFAQSNNIVPLLDVAQFYSLERALRTLYVGNVPADATEEDLRRLFEEYGDIEQCLLIPDDETENDYGANRSYHSGYGFVIFVEHSAPEACVRSRTATVLMEQQLSVQMSRPNRKIMEDAHQAGLVDIDSNPTVLFTALLSAAKQYSQNRRGTFANNVCYMQNPLNGQVFVVNIPPGSIMPTVLYPTAVQNPLQVAPTSDPNQMHGFQANHLAANPLQAATYSAFGTTSIAGAAIPANGMSQVLSSVQAVPQPVQAATTGNPTATLASQYATQNQRRTLGYPETAPRFTPY